MANAQKRIRIIHTGGTFGMIPQHPRPTLAPQQVQQQITTYVPELRQIADIDFKVMFNIDSANMRPHHWQMLAREIHASYEDFDGFVIIHGTDSMVYTASALSFMLPGLGKPVILTGSQRPLAEIRNDARGNLVNAVELATYQIPEVSIFFGTRLLRGNRAIKSSTTGFGAFSSPNYPPLAEVGVDIEIYRDDILTGGRTPELSTHASASLAVTRFFPGLTPDFLKSFLEIPINAIIIEGLGMGNVNIDEASLCPMVEALTAAGKLVIITSQSRHGQVDLKRYENGRRIGEAGAIGNGDMTTETTIVKTMHLLGKHQEDIDAVRGAFCQSLAGEITL